MKGLISLLAAAIAVVMLAFPGFAQSTSYTWQLDCKYAAANGSAGSGVSWSWLHDGVQIAFTSPPNGSVACVSTPLSGSGVVPESINGIQVNGIEVDLSLSEFPAGCQAFAAVKKSFDPSNPKFSINESVSVPNNNGFNPPAKCPAASFRFSISTT